MALDRYAARPLPTSLPSDARGFLSQEFQSLQRVMLANEVPAVFDVTKFGAKGNGRADDTIAIAKAINACPSGGIVRIPPGTFVVAGGEIVVNKRIAVVGYGDHSRIVPAPGTTGALLTITNAGASSDDLNFNDQLDCVRLEGVTFTDPNFRTATVDGIKLVGLDEFFCRNVHVFGLKGYGVKLDSTGAVRESSFYGLRVWWCGDPAQSKPSLWIESQASGDQHNEIIFYSTKVNYSYERHIVIDGLDALGPRFILFKGFQVEGIQADMDGNSLSTAAYDLVQVRKAGHGIVWLNGTIGQNTGYVAATTVGYACMRLGATATGVSGQVKLTNVYLGDFIAPQGVGGTGIVVDYCQQLSLTGVRFLTCPGGTLAIGTYAANAVPGSTPSANAFNDVVDIDVTTRFGGTDPIGETQKITGRSGDADINFYNDNVHLYGTGSYQVRHTGTTLNRSLQHVNADNTVEYFGIEESANDVVLHTNGRPWRLTASVVGPLVTLTDGATVAVNPELGNVCYLAAGGSRTMSNPSTSNALAAGVTQSLTIRIKNNTAGVITTTWSAKYKLAGGAWTDPAAAKERSITFTYDQPSDTWKEAYRSSGDV